MIPPSRMGLTAVVAVGVLLRLLPLLLHHDHPGVFLDPDSGGYHRIATNLLAGHGYSWSEAPPYRPNLYRPPGLPLLLAALYSVTGESVACAIALQILVAGLTIFLTCVLVSRWTGNGRLGLLAAAVLAIDPVAIYYTNFLLTEVYSAFFVVAALLLTNTYLKSASPRYLLALGGLLAVAILVHPLLLLSPLLVAALPLFSAATRTRRHAVAAGAALLIAWTPAVAWVYRNHVVGDYAGISSVAAVNLLKYKAAGVLAAQNGTTREAERDRLTAECEAQLPAGCSEGERFRLWQTKATAILRDDPWTYAKLHLRGDALQLLGPERDHLARFTFGGRALDENGRVTDASIEAARRDHGTAATRGFAWAVLLLQTALLLATAAGVVVALVQCRWAWLCLLVPAVYVLALAGGPEASPRFRSIYLPTLCAFTAVGVRALRIRRATILPLADIGKLPQKQPSRMAPPAAAW